jgi:hypothetical protein
LRNREIAGKFRLLPIAYVACFHCLVLTDTLPNANRLAAAQHGGSASSASPSPPAIVIGFVGGFVAHNDAAHREVQLAAGLRTDYPTGVDVSVFANHRGRQARERILRLLDGRHRNARIILYGHSWGASEAIRVARILQKDGVPVSLAIPVDSVWKPGGDDRFTPANVVTAVNFYQLDGLFHGQWRIVAIDPIRTRILGNFQFDYRNDRIACDAYPWYARLFMKPHIEIESDPRVWDRVDSLIRSELPLATAGR